LESGRLKDPPLSLILSYLHTLGIPYSRFFSELEGIEIKEKLQEVMAETKYPQRQKRKKINILPLPRDIFRHCKPKRKSN